MEEHLVLFNPLTEEEIQTASLLLEGIYQYEVVHSEDKISQAGNEYTAITLKVWDGEGRIHTIFTNMALVKLLKHFCDVNHMQDKYLSGNIPAYDFMAKRGGLVVIGIEGEKPNPKGGMYKAKNVVKDYILDNANPSMLQPLKKMPENELNDDIPF